VIRIDDDAARLGWAKGSGQWSEISGQPAAGGVDLFTVVMHEMGHLIGLEHSQDDHDLMARSLSSGTRRSAFTDLLGVDTGANTTASVHRMRPVSSGSESIASLSGWQRASDALFGSLGSSGSQELVSLSARRAARQEAAVSKVDRDEPDRPAAVRPSDEEDQLRVPRRRRDERHEQAVDEAIAQLLADA